MKNRALLGVLMTLVFHSIASHGEPLDALPVLTNGASVGWGFRNLYSTASMEEAIAKRERFRKSEAPVSVAEFLGCKIRLVQLISFAGAPDQGCALIRDLLGSVIMAPGHTSPSRPSPSCDGPLYAEGNSVTVRAFLVYDNDRKGILESDGRHLFVQDGAGTYWWHRWDAFFPRELIKKPSQPAGAASWRQPAAAQTNRTPATAGSDR